jgi:iron complex outermembrane receptor protein
MRRRLGVSSLACLMLGWLNAGLVAAETPQTTPKSTLEEHVQVTATRIPEKTGTTPASVTVITRDDLIRRGAYDLRSALALAAGLDIAPGGDGGPAGYVPEFWGLKEFDAFLLAVDGVPWGGAFNPALTTLDLTDVDRIEILRGAAPVMYGATSFVGVINVIHRAPGEGGTTLRTSGGSYGSGSAAWSAPLGPWAGVASSLSLDAARQGFSDDRTQYDRGHLLWRNSRALGSGVLRFGLDGTWLRQDPASPHPRVGTTLSSLVPVDANHNMDGAHVNERRHALDVSYERKTGSRSWSTTLSASHAQQNVLRGFLTDVSAVAPNAHGFRQIIPTTDLYFDSHVALSPGSKVEVVAGVDHLHGRGSGRGGDFDYFANLDGSAPPSGSSLADQSSVKITDRREFSGLYGQVTWTPVERWHFELGGRVNRTAEARFTDSLEFSAGVPVIGEDHRTTVRGSGFAGLTWTAWQRDVDALHLFANYRDTYKPAAIDFGLDAEPEILAPETAQSYEGGLKTRLLHDRLSVELSAFQMDFENLVLSQIVGGLPSLVNGGTQRFRGAEIEVVTRPHPGLTWRTVYSLHDARFRDFVTEFGGVPTQLAGKRLEMSARNMAATEVLLGKGTGWQGSARANWVGSRFLNKRNTSVAPDYITWSAGVGYRLHDVEIRLDGWNLNDQRPPVAESELGDAQYYLLPARRLELSARWVFGGGSD